MYKIYLDRYKSFFSQDGVVLSLITSGVFYICSLIFNFYSGVYATAHASNYVEDIVLSNIPVVEDVGYIFVWGAFALIAFIVTLNLIHPKRIPYTLHALSLFYLIRGTFVSLTHLAPYTTRASLNLDVNGLLAKQFGGADLFFSAHTGVPFLFALIFWPYKRLRYIFLIWSFIFAIVVLLGHLHYSIDVLSAFFITYTIFEISKVFFPRDYLLFYSKE